MKEEKKRDALAGVIPDAEAGLLLIKLECFIEESGKIAEYINETVHYGRILGYAEGRYDAYTELYERVINGEFCLGGKEG